MPAHGASVSGLAGAMRPMRLEDLEKDIVANTAPGLNAQAVAPHSQHERQTVVGFFWISNTGDRSIRVIVAFWLIFWNKMKKFIFKIYI